MLQSAAIEVAVALIFVYFLFSLVCSKVNEYVASAFRWRARGLEEALCKLLDDPTGAATAISSSAFFDESMVKAMVDPSHRRPVVTWLTRRRDTTAKVPSYLAAATFSGVVSRMLGTDNAQRAAAVAALPDTHPLKKPLADMLQRAGDDVDRFRASVERLFDNAMDRVSGWYKRRVQKFLTFYALVVALLFNVDTIAIATTLWTQPTVRASMVELAETTATTVPGGEATAVDPKKVAEQIRDEVGVPLGWKIDTKPWDLPLDWDLAGRVLSRAAGLLVTVLALTMGAPFWFDTLNKISQMRSSGNKPARAAPKPAA
ncbi:MAG: hypothetical protein M3394_06610 [Actinomycetota bacterium]|nr:hypothetical protein [Actinomycetota bacterium]